MSQQQIELNELPFCSGEVAIVASKWHAELVSNMVEKCSDLLKRKGIRRVDVYTMPGTLELPLGVEILATDPAKKYAAFVCLSVVEKGDTAHFDMIIHSTTKTLQELSVKHQVPVINEILAVFDIKDAIARASSDDFNKGIEAAAATLEMIDFISRQRQARRSNRNLKV